MVALDEVAAGVRSGYYFLDRSFLIATPCVRSILYRPIPFHPYEHFPAAPGTPVSLELLVTHVCDKNIDQD
jgi:hypothetical protein